MMMNIWQSHEENFQVLFAICLQQIHISPTLYMVLIIQFFLLKPHPPENLHFALKIIT